MKPIFETNQHFGEWDQMILPNDQIILLAKMEDDITEGNPSMFSEFGYYHIFSLN